MRLTQQIKRKIAFLLLLVTAITSMDISGFTAYADTTEVQSTAAATFTSSEYVTVVRTGSEVLGVQFKGDEAGAVSHRFTYPTAAVKDTPNTAAYCITPFARGVSPSGQAQTFSLVPDSQLDERDKQLLGIMMAGYPTKIHGGTVQDEYTATQIAIQHFLFQNTDKYPNLLNVKFNNDDWSHWENKPVVELAKIIYTEGMANPYEPGTSVGGTEINAEAENNGRFYDRDENIEFIIKIDATGDFSVGKLTLPDEIKNIVKSGLGTIQVDGTTVSFKNYILGSDDSYEGIQIQQGNSQVKITLDKKAAEAYVAVPGEYVTVDYQFEVISNTALQAYKGLNLNNNNQDYIFNAPGSAAPASGELLWTREEEPPSGGGGDGGLKILKYNKKTNQLVSGTIFEIRGVSENNWDFLVHIQASPGAAIPLPNGGTATTGVGYIELRDIPTGQYQITEITPPPNFDYCDLGVNSQVVTVVKNEVSSLYPQVRFENNPYGKLKIRKIDSITGSPVNGAILRISNPLADFSVEMVTANGGIIELNNLPQGNYEITEVFAPNTYVQSTETKVATIRWGETTDITFENTPKTEVQVKKIDAETGKALQGAIFRLTKPDTGDVYEEITYYDGIAVFQNIPSGTYILEEIQAPNGYLLNTEQRVIVVENYKVNEFYMSNYKRPSLIIRKYDEDTSLLLENAEFSIAKKGGAVIYEGMTDQNGEIRIDDLETGWFTITELAPPHGYIITTKERDVFFEAGQELEVKFDNRKRPELEIIKTDDKGSPLAKALFQIKKADGETIFERWTDENGRILITFDDEEIWLEEAVYSIKEVLAPDGYILDADCHKDITLVWGQRKTLTFTNTKKPTLEILKIDSVTKEPIPNTKYRVTKIEDATVSEYLTDNDGRIFLENLDEGIYKIEETVANNKYILHSETKDIELLAGDEKQLIFENDRKPTLIITKINALTQKGIPNTTYKIEYELSNGGIKNLGTFKTDNNGQIILKNVDVGWYQITETIPAQGMQLPSNPVTRKYLSEGENAYLDTGTGGNNNSSGNGNGTEPSQDGITVTSGWDYMNEQGEIITNYPLNSLVIKKNDANTSEMLAGAVFEVRKLDGEISGTSGTIIGRYTSDSSGIIVITGLEAGGYIVEEVAPPNNYLLSENSKQTTWLKADQTSCVEITFSNYPYGHLLISKVDSLTNKPLANARFKVTGGDGSAIGNTTGEFITDNDGQILIENIKPQTVVITELEAPENYAIDTTPQTVSIGTDGKVYKVSFRNNPYGTLVIKKYSSYDNSPLQGAEFFITNTNGEAIGNNNGVYVTDQQGTITIPNLDKQSLIVKETKSPDGFILSQKTEVIDIEYGQTHVLNFYNSPKASLIVKKTDEKGYPLSGAVFRVERQNGALIGEFTSDNDGTFVVPELEPQWVTIREIQSPEGYLIGEGSKTVEIKEATPTIVTFVNKKITGLQIKKIDEDSQLPLSGVVFMIEKLNGERVGDELVTDENGLITVELEPDHYIVREIRQKDGYVPDNSSRTVEVKTTEPTLITITNKKLGGLQIRKVDQDNNPLSGVVFSVETMTGERVSNAELVTDNEGIIYIPDLSGDYVIREIKGKDGYAIDTTARNTTVKANELTVETFVNTKLGGLQIKKINSVTHVPIANVEFTVKKLNGELVGVFKTGNDGLLYIPDLEGVYTYQETKGVDGYIVDTEPVTVEIKQNEIKTVIVENTPISSLLIIKTDMQTKKPLAGVKFQVTRDNGEIIGTFSTDKNGYIYVNGLESGNYKVFEVEALNGYELDTTVYDVVIKMGEQTKLTVQNKPLAGLRIKKIDAITKQGLYGVEFMVFDQNGKVVANVYSDNNGIVDLSALLVEGRYTIRETRPAANYYSDDTPRTVEFIAGKMTEIVWENQPMAGQIQVLKLSANYNEQNGLDAGTPLQGAIFGVYEYKSGNLVDRFITGNDGKGVSKPLPLGRYILKEEQSPAYYSINNKEIDITIEFATQIVKVEVTNESANTGVSIDKVAPKEVMPNQEIRYDIKNIRNDSTVALSDFYFRDVLPVDAVRLDRIVTGTYNVSMKYKITATTNKGNTMVIADNLMTTKNNVIECGNAALGLANDEFVTSFTFYFGTVKPGFCIVEEPKIYARTLNKSFPAGYMFANKIDVGGMFQGEWVIGNSTAVTTIYMPTETKLPKTGN